MTFHHRLLHVLLVLALAGCAAPSQRYTLPAEPGWEKIAVAGIDQARLKAGTDLRRYNAVLVLEPDLEYDSKWFKAHRHDMSASDDSRIRASYTGALKEALAEAFADRGLATVTSATGNTLVLNTRLTEFRLNAPDLSFAPHRRSFVDFAGSARLELVLQDGATNEPVAEFNDYSKTRSFGGFGQLRETNRLVNLRDFRWMARQWSGNIAEYVGGR